MNIPKFMDIMEYFTFGVLPLNILVYCILMYLPVHEFLYISGPQIFDSRIFKIS